MADLTIPAADGYPLGASEFQPADPPSGVVLFSPATGVRRSLYRRLAAHLAARGFVAVTWDWRGTGDSRPASLRGFPGTMRDWAEQDLAGVVEWASERYPSLPLLALCHSFGGQALGLTPAALRLRAAVTVASQSGYYGWWPAPHRYLYAALWHLFMPGLTGLVGWFPARPIGLGEDLPRGVALEWSRWCRRPEYLGDWDGHRRFDRPLYVIGFTDDPYAPPAAVAALHDHYSGPQVRRILSPEELGRRNGHLGFFREEQPLWHDVADWLASQVGAGRTG